MSVIVVVVVVVVVVVPCIDANEAHANIAIYDRDARGFAEAPLIRLLRICHILLHCCRIAVDLDFMWNCRVRRLLCSTLLCSTLYTQKSNLGELGRVPTSTVMTQ